jgi:hypothetical protein
MTIKIDKPHYQQDQQCAKAYPIFGVDPVRLEVTASYYHVYRQIMFCHSGIAASILCS